MRDVCGSDLVAAVVQTSVRAGDHADDPGTMSDIIGVITGSDIDEETMRKALHSRLPSYMLPRRIIRLDNMPLNASGKIDRNAIVALLDQALIIV